LTILIITCNGLTIDCQEKNQPNDIFFQVQKKIIDKALSGNDGCKENGEGE
jgi:hypothetical protein